MADTSVLSDKTADEREKTPALRKRYRLLISGVFLWWVFALISADIFPFAQYDANCPIIVHVCILIGAIGFLALFSQQRNLLKPWLMRATPLVATVATFLLSAAQTAAMPPVLLYLAGLLAGACAGCFLLGWGALYAKYHLDRITLVALCSVAIGGGLLWLETLIPSGGFRCFPVHLAPLIHLWLFFDIDPLRISRNSNTEPPERFMGICLSTAPLHGGLYGIMAGLGLASTAHLANPISGVHGLGICVVFLVLAGAAVFTLNRLQFNIIHRPVIILLIPGLMMGTFILADTKWHGDFWIMCAILLYLTFLWIACCDISDILHLNVLWFFAIRFALALGSLSVGFGLGYGLATLTASIPHVTLAAVVIIWLFLVISSITTMEDQEALNATADQAAAVPASEISIADMCASLADRYTLSVREIEVLELLAQGRDPSRIQEQLFVSYHTVRNHIKNIYKKLDVHSRQELIDVLEREMERVKQAKAATEDKPEKTASKAKRGSSARRSS